MSPKVNKNRGARPKTHRRPERPCLSQGLTLEPWGEVGVLSYLFVRLWQVNTTTEQLAPNRLPGESHMSEVTTERPTNKLARYLTSVRKVAVLYNPYGLHPIFSPFYLITFIWQVSVCVITEVWRDVANRACAENIFTISTVFRIYTETKFM